MVFVVKGMLIVFMLIGIPIAVYGAWEIWETMNFVNASPGRLKAKFVGYDREYHKHTNIPSASDITSSHSTSYSLASYPVFTYRTEDGSERRGARVKGSSRGSYKAGEEVDVLRLPAPLLQIHVLPVSIPCIGRDMAILVLGFCFLLIPMAIWKVAVPSLETPEVSREFTGMLKHVYGLFGELKVGPDSLSLYSDGFLWVHGAGIVAGRDRRAGAFFSTDAFGGWRAPYCCVGGKTL